MWRCIACRSKGRGFTLVELMVSVAIVAILSSVSTVLHRGYVKRALAAEGIALVGGIRRCQQIHYAEHGEYTGAWGDLCGNFDLEHFKFFNTVPTLGLTRKGQGFTASVRGQGKAAGIVVSIDNEGNIRTDGT